MLLKHVGCCLIAVCLLNVGCSQPSSPEPVPTVDTPAEPPSEPVAETPESPDVPVLPPQAPIEPVVRDEADLSAAMTPPTEPVSPTSSVVEPITDVAATSAVAISDGPEQPTDLEAEIAAFQIPPTWIKDVTSTWDVANKPWKEARLEIRRLLGIETEESRREAIKLTWDYLQKKDMGNGHEYGMYMFLGNEPVWAVIAFREEIAEDEHEYPPFFAWKSLSSLYADYGLFEEAEDLLEESLASRPPKKPWYEVREAEGHDALGDLYAKWGKTDLARKHYQDAVRIYPTGKPPYGKHLLPRRAKKVQAKLDLLDGAALANARLKDGTYNEKAIGYSGDLNMTVKITGGQIADIKIKHQEKIDQNATKIIPERIIESQSLDVDGISGATVTKDAIMAGTLRALRKAGLK